MNQNIENYKSDQDLAGKIYKMTRKRYPQFKLGIFLLLCMIAGIAYDGYNQYLWIVFGCSAINIAIHVVIAAIFICLSILAVIYMLSGGKKKLFRDETVSYYEDHISICYEEKKWKTEKNIYFCDLERLFYEEDKKRLVLKSDCQIKHIFPDDVKLIEKNQMTTYLYGKYKDFEEMGKLLEELSRKKIESNSQLY